ncbi:MAG: N-acetylmuramoyl-L-alanine amidase [Thermoanaerobaculia bacterium]|nr:N-acetylmuramoyl-L-alanine amidase [Thermoanaerobaculia bacterium]
MKAEKIDRVRRRLLAEAVADNLATIQGLPPRALRTQRRLLQTWLRRAPLVLVPLMFVAFMRVEGRGSRVEAIAIETRPPAEASIIESPRSTNSQTLRSNRDTQRAALGALETPLAPVTTAAFPLSVRRVVLDAGHGGSDPGATRLALIEKHVTLDIGDRLRRKLEANGFEVVVTRSEDETVPLRERARLANASRADIFVSIHVNALLKHTAAHGVETYYLGPTNDPALTNLAATENRGSGYSLADMRKLLDGVYADARRDESRELAGAVQKHLHDGLSTAAPGLENWGVKRAPFVVLVATDMPAVLAEVGCISNEREAAMLTRPEYRQRIADALYAGISSYASANDAPQKKGT